MEELERYEERLRTAMLEGDVDALDALIADDLVFIGPDGSVATKADDLAVHRAGKIRIREMRWGERETRPLEGAVLTIVRADLVVEIDGTRIEGPYRYLRVWRTSPEGWQVVGGQVSATP